MDDMNNLKNSDALFDQSLLDELNAATSDGPSEVSEHTSDGEVADKSDSERAASDKPSDDELPVKKADDTERAAKKIFMVRVLAVAVAVLGMIMLVCGIALHRLDEESRRTPEKEQMPEEYIEEFFSDEKFTPNIEDYIEPEA